MEINTIDASLLAKMFLAGVESLEAKKEWINELNVFPVPDGDTGTNMTMTIIAAAKEVNALEKLDMPSLAKAISSGSLRGARGNSGVILSQLFRGFTKVISHYDKIDVIVLSDALQKGVETAYKAVMKPKEGTILTVAKGAADKALEMIGETEDLAIFFGEVIKHAEYILSKTPEMLPVLKQAGVVDSGGQGLLEIYRGAYDALLGKEVSYTRVDTTPAGAMADIGAAKIIPQVNGDITFGYCTEFIIVLQKELSERQELDFKAYLESVGDSIVVVSDDEITKVHVHTNDPGLILQRALMYGSLSKIKIDNMREEHTERFREKQTEEAGKAAAAQMENPKQKKTGFISVSAGEGLNDIFKGLGVDYIIEGGQTMNPSTEDMLNAIDEVHAENVFILPNNKNIILAANQAASLIEHKKIIVIPTKTIPQGITAMINYIPDKGAEDNEKRMIEEIGNIRTGQITYAIRDTIIDGKEIKQGDFMGLGDSAILTVGPDMETVTRELVRELEEEDSTIISVYYGEEVKEDAANKLAAYLEKTYPECEVEVHSGGQPIYYYIISVE